MSEGSAEYSLDVVAPVATAFGTEHRPLAPRPTSLEGLTLGLLWNVKPNGDVALRAAAAAIEAQVEGLKVRFYDGGIPVASALLDRIAHECDVVLACTADCGSCTSWLTHDCVQLERRGTPAVIICSAGFEDDLETSARAFGMPGLQYALVPKVYNNIEPEEAEQITRPVVGELVKLLTSGVVAPGTTDATLTETQVINFTGPEPLAVLEQFNARYLANEWGAGLPLLPRVPQRVAALVAAVDGGPDDLVCVLPPGNGRATVHNVAVNAAMAGCTPQEMPTIMAALRAVAKVAPPWNLAGLMSTSAHAPIFFTNGPVGGELGINGGRGCLGPGKQNAVNLRIGRAILLCLKNIGVWNHGVMDMDSVGSPRKHISFFAENEAESPWPAFHVSRGYRTEQSTVTVLFTQGELDMGIQGHTDGRQLAKAIASMVPPAGSLPTQTFIFGDEVTQSPEGRLVIIPPPHAVPIAEAGFTKDGLARLFHNEVRDTVEKFREPLQKLNADGKTRPEWAWMFDLSAEEARRTTVQSIERPDQFYFVVAGSVRAKDLSFPTVNLPVTEPIVTNPAGLQEGDK
ncbi:MAG: hypothetical protein AB7L84_05590 [Acidimicrobiia bacterium]